MFTLDEDDEETDYADSFKNSNKFEQSKLGYI